MRNQAEDVIFDRKDYYIELAEHRRLTDRWGENKWQAKQNPNGISALYYRTDTNGGKAVLHMVDGDVELLAGRVYFIPAFSVLYSELDGFMEKYYIHFQAQSLALGLYRHFSHDYSVPANEITQTLFKIVVDHYKDSGAEAKLKVRGAMDLLLSDFFANATIESNHIKKFKPVFSYMEEHYRENITLAQMADVMHMSTAYFSNAFKNAFHISPKQYMLSKRLAESQRLLRETDLSIQDIAHAVGFENESYFSEFFTSKIGVTASKFRQHSFPNKK